MIEFNKPDPRFQEILHLRSMLNVAKIPYECRCEMGGYIIRCPTWDDYICSAIEHIGSDGHTEDLIELTVISKEINATATCGWLTAKDVYGIIKDLFINLELQERGSVIE